MHIKWCMKNIVHQYARHRVLHARYEPPVTNTGVALASFQSYAQFTTRMRLNTIHGRLGKTSNKSVYQAYINEEQRHDKCTVLHYKRSQKKAVGGEGRGVVKDIAHISFFLLKL